MRRQSVILAAFFALFLATFAPIRAQESASTDENAGIMLTATDGVAFTSLEALARDYCGYASSPPSGFSLNYYQLGLVDLPDPGVYDCWLFAYGFLSSVESNGTITAAGGKLGQLVVIRLGNGNWATTSGIETVNVASGYWPVYFRIVDGDLQGVTFYDNSNVADLDCGVASSFMSNFRDFVVASQNLPITDSVITSLYDYARLNNFETYDADGGGVIDLVEWVRGGNLSYWQDDVKSSDPGCKCGACCSCECVCGQWSGAECGKTSNDCACHPKEPDCTCADYCCACECKCEKCADGTHSAHQNGSDTCDGTIGDIIGFVGCDCHKTTEEKECECAKYCCKHTCKCEKCGDGEHSAHENGSATCDNTDGEDGCDCHKTDDPEEETCTCANYCCYHTCACPVHKDKSASEHSQHGNNSPTCDGTTGSGGCDCHETTDDEECACANYCCACKCECKKCKAAGSCSGNHKNGDSKCDGVASGSTYCCDCHASGNPENPEETPCTCANYCCHHTCECKRCASLPAASHSQHKNGSPTCNGTTGSGGCSCHQDDFPEGEAPTVGRNNTFIENSEFDKQYQRLLSALEQKFKISFFQNAFGNFQGDAKLPVYETPRIFDRTGVTIDLNKAAESKPLMMLRGIMVASLYFFTFARIFHSLRKLAG
ncbi:MAG: hypothetical protein J6K25_06980 [Thermoguttaceae bacterium]|nr:hypothetical protein [Thermoguttaceae bacterium]